MSRQNENQKYLLCAAEAVAERFGPYYVETGAALILIDRYNNGSSLLDAAGICEQQIQEMMESLLRL
jgi:hypothetical protein